MDQYWVGGKPPEGAKDSCAQQGLGNPDASWGSDMGSGAQAHVISAYCVPKDSTLGKVAQCTSGMGIPEQVNVQVASGDSVVLSFVTFEETAPTKPPMAKVNVAGAAEMEVKGVTHKHVTVGCTAGGVPDKNGTLVPEPCRTYYMHFIKLSEMKPKAKYSYTVQSGGAGSVPSAQFSFRAPYSEGVTKIALYGDMGGPFSSPFSSVLISVLICSSVLSLHMEQHAEPARGRHPERNIRPDHSRRRPLLQRGRLGRAARRRVHAGVRAGHRQRTLDARRRRKLRYSFST